MAQKGFGQNTPDFMTRSVAKKQPPKGAGFGAHTPDFMTRSVAPSAREVQDWMRKNATTALGMRKNIMNRLDRSRDSNVIGKMYFFWYDAKHKATLPVWDRFPLVIPIEHYADGFLGLNLHYLPPNLRTALLTQLLKYKSAINMTESSRLKLSYELIAGTATMKLAEPCIHRYLYSHVQSPFVEVQPKEWDKAMALPVSQFVYNKQKKKK